MWANISPTGMLGVFWLPVMPALLLVLGESQLASQIFAEPGFQNLAIASLAAVGTVAVLSAIASSRYARKAWLLPALSAVVVANAVVWGAVWLPQLGATWLHITPAAARTLARIESQIGSTDEVVASQGISGGLSYHPAAYSLFSATETIPVKAAKIWIILAPEQGIETAQTGEVYGDIGVLTTMPGARLVAAANGIWAFVAPTQGSQDPDDHSEIEVKHSGVAGGGAP